MGAAPNLDQMNDIIGLLSATELFAGSPPQALEFAAQHLESIRFLKGEPIVLENEASDHVYFVRSGSVEILSYTSELKKVQRMALLKAGSHFAEFSVLTQGTKSGSVYAYEDSQLLRMPGQDFLLMLRKFPTVARKLALNLADLNYKVEATSDFIPYYNPNKVRVTRELGSLLPMPFWKRFNLVPVDLRAGALSVAMVNPFDEAAYQALRSIQSNLELLIHLIPKGEFDGAVDHITKLLKSAGAAPEVQRQSFKDLADLITKSPLTKELPENVRSQIIPYLKPVEIRSGQIVMKAGSAVDQAMLILRGKFQVTMSIPRTHGSAMVMELTAGDVYGLENVLIGKNSLHQVKSVEDSVVVALPKALLEQLMGTPLFTVPLARLLAERLQRLGHGAGIKFYKSLEVIDFKPVASLLPLGLIKEHSIIPLRLEDNEVLLGAVDPDPQVVFSLVGRYLLDYRTRMVGISAEQFDSFSQQLKIASDQIAAELGSTTATNLRVVNSDPTKLLDEILLTGLTNRSSDIHFEPTENHLLVRYRVDGVLIERAEKIPNEVAREVIGRIKVLSNMDISQQKLPQDGQLKTKIGEVQIVARASSLPIKFGEKLVLRIIRSKNSVVPINMLAPDRRAIKILQGVAASAQGLFLVTGPTGSGKTTTLYSLLNEINRVDVNVITLEEPVEMEIQGFNQCEIDRKRGLDFNLALRSVLRQDPDVVMVGEIRDGETAKIVFEAAITGHLVLSTLHTNSSLDVAPRLRELGVESATMAAGLLGVLTQRLVRAVCKKCADHRPVTESDRHFIRSVLGSGVLIPEQLKFGRGCPACYGTGYYDRLPVLEIWRATLEMKQALIEGADIKRMEEIARKDGYETLLEFGLRLALAGLTSLEEVKRCLSNV